MTKIKKIIKKRKRYLNQVNKQFVLLLSVTNLNIKLNSLGHALLFFIWSNKVISRSKYWKVGYDDKLAYIYLSRFHSCTLFSNLKSHFLFVMLICIRTLKNIMSQSSDSLTYVIIRPYSVLINFRYHYILKNILPFQ